MPEQKHQTPDSLINQTGSEKGSALAGFPSYKVDMKHENSNKTSIKKARTWETWLKKWEMSSLKISVSYLQMEWKPQEADKDAAWELYIELLTRITTQPLPLEHGDEKTALDSIYSLFGLTRHIIKSHKRKCIEFTKIAIVVLNQVIRPFTAKWHKISIEQGFEEADICKDFRKELMELQKKLCIYTKMLADMAGVEDLTNLENIN